MDTSSNQNQNASNGLKVYLASDHAGLAMKTALRSWLEVRAFEVEDCGAEKYDEYDDYPDFISIAAQKPS